MKWLIIILNCIPCVFLNIYTQKLSRVIFNGILYQEPYPWSKSLLYSKTIDDSSGVNYWKNLSALTVKYGLRSNALFCMYGNGGWLVYPDENMKIRNTMSLQIMVQEACVKTEKILSIQPLGPINKLLGSHSTQGLITFQSIYYTSPYTLELPSPSVSGRIKSLIHSGHLNWTVEGYILAPNGKMKSIGVQLCVLGIPTVENHMTFCGIPDVDFLMGEVTDKIEVRSGCNIQKMTKVAKQSCYTEGTYKILVESEIPEPPSTCKKYLETLHKRLINEFGKILEIWKLRMGKSSQEDRSVESYTIHDSKSNRHLHEIFKDEMNNLIPKFGFLIQTLCPDIAIDYSIGFTHLLDMIASQIFLSEENNNIKTRFVSVITELQASFNTCKLTSDNNASDIPISSNPMKSGNNSAVCNENKLYNGTASIIRNVIDYYSEIPFVDFFPNVLHMLKAKCSTQPPSNELYQEFHNFLSSSKLDWNTIYEVGLNGLHIAENEASILKCLGNSNFQVDQEGDTDMND